MTFDVCVIGGGIVGLATAYQLLLRRPGAGVVVLEKEDRVAAHQSGHNSGVIHAGLYYAPGSLKAELCRAGLVATKAFCAEHGVPYDPCGKLVVATSPAEEKRLSALIERCRVNGIDFEVLSADALREREPNVSGTRAILSPATGIVDYARVCTALAEAIRARGGVIELGVQVDAIAEDGDGVTVSSGKGASERRWRAARMVACAGLQADRVAQLAGLRIDFRIVPFRGEYYVLPRKHDAIVRHLIYPVPDPALPFLGVHLTRMIDGRVTVGPNAVFAWKREGYDRVNFSLRDTVDAATWPGTWRVLQAHRASALTELRNSWSKRGYLAECRKYCPSLTLDDLLPYRPGVRAQAVLRDGTLVHDFLFAETPRSLHVCNAPSPAATSALPIGDHLVTRLLGAA